jgi:hypothetical protein
VISAQIHHAAEYVARVTGLPLGQELLTLSVGRCLLIVRSVGDTDDRETKGQACCSTLCPYDRQRHDNSSCRVSTGLRDKRSAVGSQGASNSRSMTRDPVARTAEDEQILPHLTAVDNDSFKAEQSRRGSRLLQRWSTARDRRTSGTEHSFKISHVSFASRRRMTQQAPTHVAQNSTATGAVSSTTTHRQGYWAAISKN